MAFFSALLRSRSFGSHFYRVPLCVPYWNKETYRAAFLSFLCGRVVDGPDIERLKSFLIETLGVENTLLFGSGSLALELALRFYAVGEGDEVVVPSFCCSAVIPPILAVGATPALADVGADLNINDETVERALTKKTKAIIVPHLFGNPADIQPIVELARDRGIRVIDDAAQALGATIDDRPAGTFGDAGILSFGSEKICFGSGGGALFWPSKIRLNDNFKSEREKPDLFESIGRFVSTLLWCRWRRWTLPLKGAACRAEGPDPDLPPLPYRRHAMANLNAAVALSLMRNLNQNLAKRRARAQRYKELLGKDDAMSLIAHKPGSACLTQVLRVVDRRRRDGEMSSLLVGALRNAGYEVRGSYVPIHLLAPYKQWFRQPLPYAERVWSDLVELPCEPDVRLDDVEKIAQIVKRTLSA